MKNTMQWTCGVQAHLSLFNARDTFKFLISIAISERHISPRAVKKLGCQAQVKSDGEGL